MGHEGDLMGKTSWQVKQRYNNKVYGTILVRLPKDLVKEFKEKCKVENISQAQVVREAVEKFIR